MTHTPGPWTASEPSELDGKCSVYANGPIAYLGDNGAGIENVQANANLMAAAPELLAALEALLEHESEDLDVPVSEMIGGVWGIARNAINKAKGV
jgi:hypothetical protein